MNTGEPLRDLSEKLAAWWHQFVLHLPNMAIAVLVVVAFWLAAKAVRNLMHRGLTRFSHSEQITKLIVNVLYVAMLSFGVFIALGILGLDKTVTSLLAGAGILGLALGFAFQDLGANFISGIYLAIRHTFKVGELIESNSYFGTVTRINLRSTELRTPQGQLVLIPNKEVFENPIKNFSLTGHRRIDLKVGVSYGDDLAKVRRVTMQAVEGVPGREPDRPVEFFYEEYGDSSINFTVRFWIPFRKQTDYLQARSEAIERIKKAYDQEDITIPFPIRTLDFGIKGGQKLDEVMARTRLSLKHDGDVEASRES